MIGIQAAFPCSEFFDIRGRSTCRLMRACVGVRWFLRFQGRSRDWRQ